MDETIKRKIADDAIGIVQCGIHRGRPMIRPMLAAKIAAFTRGIVDSVEIEEAYNRARGGRDVMMDKLLGELRAEILAQFAEEKTLENKLVKEAIAPLI